jgi:hypothetical protein
MSDPFQLRDLQMPLGNIKLFPIFDLNYFLQYFSGNQFSCGTENLLRTKQVVILLLALMDILVNLMKKWKNLSLQIHT